MLRFMLCSMFLWIYTVRFSHRKHNLIAVFGIDVFNVPIIVTVIAYPLRSEAINLRTNYYVLL